jgi:hypothetical protein
MRRKPEYTEDFYVVAAGFIPEVIIGSFPGIKEHLVLME